MSSPYPVATPQRGGWTPLRISGLVLTVLALVVGAVCAVKLVVSVATPAARLVQSEARTTPLDDFFDLDAGGQRVYVLVEGRAGSYQAPNLGPGDIEVAGPSGTVVVRSVSLDEEVDLVEGHFVAIAAFDAPMDGQYRVTISDAQETVVVGPSILSGFGQAGGWLVGTLVSGLALVVGLGLLIASFVRRRPVATPYPAYPGQTSAPAQQAPWQQAQQIPAGWYLDPQSPQQLRYWDGAGWTAHVQPRP